MKGIIVMKGLTDIDEKYIQAAILPEVESGKAGKTGKPKKEKRVGSFLNSGWAAACVCLAVGIVVYLAVLGLGAGKFDRLFGHGSEVTATREDPTDTTSVLESDTKPDTEAETEIIPDVAWSDEGLEFISNGDGTCRVSMAEFVGEAVRIPEISPDGDTVTSVGRFFYNARTGGVRYVYLPDTVTYIEDDAFYMCRDLEYVRLSKQLREIGSKAFVDTSLREIVLPESLEVIGEFAFGNNFLLERAVLTSGITVLPGTAFIHCSALTELVLPDGLEEIGSGAFGECRSLTHVDLPAGVLRINAEAFYGCSALTSINLGDTSLTGIGDYAFCKTALTEVTFPKTLALIGKEAFSEIDALVSVTFAPDGCLETIDEQAFAKDTHLSELVLPPSLVTIKSAAFRSCTGLCSVRLADPENSKLARIDQEAFCADSSLTTFDLRGSTAVFFIGISVFERCTSLKEIYIPRSVATLSEKAFSGCTSLEKVEFEPDSRLVWIQNELFDGCVSLTDIEIPDRICLICKHAFRGCTALRHITVPASVQTINVGAFLKCEALETVTFADDCKITEIAVQTFALCKSLRSIRLPDTVTRICEDAFCRCESLVEVGMPPRVTITDESAFTGCPYQPPVQ